MTPTLDELTARIESMAPAARAKLLAEVGKSMARHIWMPLPGPQTMAYKSQADVVGYGGSAGGGKSDLAIGKALMRHHEVLIMRREATQLKGILRRMEQILGSRDGYNGQDRRWSKAGPREVDIEFGSCPNLGDETKHQGNPHDFLCVGTGTPVVLGSGKTAPIESLKVGDYVATLEGPRRVTRVWPVRRDSAVLVTLPSGYSQIQSTSHKVLTPSGWAACRAR